MTFDLSGKRVLVTQANDYMGPQSVETFREAGAEVIADTTNLIDPEAPAHIVSEAGQLDILLANLAAPNHYGITVADLDDATWSPGYSGAKWQTVSSAGVGKAEPLSGRRYQSRYMVVIEDLLAAIEEDRQPLCGVYEARGATEMIVAVFESHRQGGPVNFPLENRNNPLTMLG